MALFGLGSCPAQLLVPDRRLLNPLNALGDRSLCSNEVTVGGLLGGSWMRAGYQKDRNVTRYNLGTVSSSPHSSDKGKKLDGDGGNDPAFLGEDSIDSQ